MPDKCPVIRIAHPQRRRPWLVTKLSVPLQLLVVARLHTALIAHIEGGVTDSSKFPGSGAKQVARVTR